MFVIFFILLFDLFIFNMLKNNLSNNILYLSRIKIEELTKYYLNNTIKKYLNLDTNDYIKINLVNNNIISVDIDNNNSNILLNNIIGDLENNIEKFVGGDINDYYNLEIIKGKNGIILYIPIGLVFNNSLLSGFGPRIPVKISFLENIDAYVDVKVENYGINNSLIKLYINIDIRSIIEIPLDNDLSNINYKFLIASKLISGKVPSIYGSNLGDNSNLVNSSVN